ncbi:MAG TPA: MASE1 domain-containing protein [Luteibacter sp.]|nr:MASE1 domain-containing protein [Luteibacter sp.]
MLKSAASEASLPLAWGAGLFVGGFVSQLASVALWNPHAAIHMVWFPGALLLASLLTAPRPCWAGNVLGLLAGVASAALMFRLPVLEVILVLAPVVISVPAVALVMLRRYADAPAFEDFRQLTLFLGLGVLALPLLSASAAYLLSIHTSLRGLVVGDWLNVVLAHALGYALCVPVWVSVVHRRAWLHHHRAQWSSLAVAVGSLVALWFVWREFGADTMIKPLLLLAPIPIVIWVTLRMRMAGTCVTMLVIAVVAAHMSLENRGPFVEEDIAVTTLSLQLWVLALSMASLLLATLIEQRRASQQALIDTHREVRELAGRLIAAQEQERARIARDLHDDINQQLASASIQLSAIRRHVDARTRGEISQLQNQLISLSDDVRRISHDLHPSMLRQTGLVAALDGLSDVQRHPCSPRIDLKISAKADNLPDAVALCLYRAAQEALGNAIKHAGSRRIDMTLEVGDRFVELVVADDGKGFVPAVVGEFGMAGLGLVSIDERAKLLGGNFDIRTSLGKGTRVCIRIPVPPSHP